jgi:hypothetical protein
MTSANDRGTKRTPEDEQQSERRFHAGPNQPAAAMLYQHALQSIFDFGTVKEVLAVYRGEYEVERRRCAMKKVLSST